MLITGAVLLAHLVLFIFFKLEYLDVFRTQPAGKEGTSELPLLDHPFSLVPYPEIPGPAPPGESPAEPAESDRVKSPVESLGEPSLEVDPIRRSPGGSAGDAQRGPRRTRVEPRPINITLPVIPDDVKGEVEGGVELRLLVDVNGRVEKVELVEGTGIESLDRTAMEAARSYRFIPGEIKGVPTAMWVRVTIGFRPK